MEISSIPLTQAAPAAGWFADPYGQGLRWWDGTQWSEHVHATPVQAPVEAAAPAEPTPAAQAQPALTVADALPTSTASTGVAGGSVPPPGYADVPAAGGVTYEPPSRPASSGGGTDYRRLAVLLIAAAALTAAYFFVIKGDKSTPSAGDQGAAAAASSSAPLTPIGDPGAMQMARAASAAAVTYAKKHGGSWNDITPAALAALDPSINTAGGGPAPYLETTYSTPDGYQVEIKSPDTHTWFTITKDSSGMLYWCSNPGEGSCPRSLHWGPSAKVPASQLPDAASNVGA